MRGKLNIWSFILLAFLLGFALADYHPKITVTKHDKPLSLLLYFDDSSNVMVLREERLEISFDDGVTFDEIKNIGGEPVRMMQLDPYYKDRAFVFTFSNKHYVTNDKGETWSSFNLKESPEVDYLPRVEINVENRDLLMIQLGCTLRDCTPKNYYSKDGLKSTDELPMNGYCKYAKLDKLFEPGSEKTLYCTHNELNEHGHVLKSSVYVSDDFFKSKSPVDEDSFKSGVILGLRIESTFLIAVVQYDKFDENSKTTILVSKDAEKFTETDLKVKSRHGRLSILYHSAQSLFIEVSEYLGLNMHSLTSTFYGTDSTGLKFNTLLENIRYPEIFKVQNIEGGWIANAAVGQDEDDGDSLIGIGNNAVKSYYTLDNGKTWDLLKVNNDDDCKLSDGCSLHIANPNVLSGEGKLVTGPTPGILMAVGNKGKKISKDFKNMSTWISRDGGVSWDLALDVPGQFTFGDQGNVILIIPWGDMFQKPNDKFYFSLDQGKSWIEEKLEIPIWGISVYTTIDGSSTKFIYNGIRNSVFDTETAFYTVDFGDAFEGNTCNDEDFEDVYARVVDEEPLCLYGQKEKFKRRKQEAKCFVNKLFDDVVSIEDKCECSILDFECAPGFKVSPKGDDVCIPDPKIIASICSDQNVEEINIPDKALISNDQCEMNKPATDFITEHKFKCSEYDDYKDGDTPIKEEISVSETDFEGTLSQYVYTEEHNETAVGENIILRTTEDVAYASNNGGASFVKIPTHESIGSIYTGYTSGKVVLIAQDRNIYISDDGGDTFQRKQTPTKAGRGRVLSFHKTDSEKFIWYGCESNDCKFNTAYYTKDNGANFEKLKDDVMTCDFIGPHLEVELDENKDLIYCSVFESNGKMLLASAKNLESEFVTIFDYIKGYAITGNFVVIATVDEEANALKASITVDGLTFADADFPSDLKVKAHQAYTILDSATHAIFIHITSDAEDGKERGVLLKSNFNGTSYVLSLDDVNRDKRGFVDYDRIDQIEGTIIVNSAFIDGSGSKTLKTQISHNDGGEWSYLVPPRLDANGNEYECSGKSLQECSLNLHGYTERSDYRDTFSSAAAVGVMFGIGNVGDSLTEKSKGSTYLTRDGGVTWKTIKEGEYMWEFGDRGTILVLVSANEDTNTLLYSLDDGENWIEYQFSDEKVSVLDLATSPSDTSTKFVIFAKSPKHRLSTRAIGIDFADVYKRQCQLDLDNPDSDDYEFWSPSHPLSVDDCLFGHEALYLRRATGHNDCFIGSAPLEEGFKVTRNCTCTRRDYECDYNYVRDIDNTCKLVKGLTPEDRMKDMCNKNDAFKYFKPTGYRKIPLSTCVGGKQYDSFDAEPCPGKEQEFNEHYGRGINKTNIWLVFGVPLFVLIFASWFVYDRGIRRNGGFKRFGQIRLDGDEDFELIENNQVDMVVNKIVKGGIVAVAGAYAGLQVVLKLDKMLLQKITSVVFRTAPGRRNYVSVPHLEEEDELFGDFRDNYDEELDDAANGLNQEFQDYDDDDRDILDGDSEVNTDSGLFNIDDEDDSQRNEGDS